MVLCIKISEIAKISFFLNYFTKCNTEFLYLCKVLYTSEL